MSYGGLDLVAYDARARDWRMFGLDAILGEIRRVGTFTRRALPAAYAEVGGVGLIKTRPRVDVTIELSAAIATAVIARSWHQDQRVVRQPDGSASITLPVYDLGEAVRWAMTFGAEARVAGPPEAVRIAAETAKQLAARYEDTAVRDDPAEKSA
jgi:predicted DNA-binding transcriptional regulator YafY